MKFINGNASNQSDLKPPFSVEISQLNWKELIKVSRDKSKAKIPSAKPFLISKTVQNVTKPTNQPTKLLTYLQKKSC